MGRSKRASLKYGLITAGSIRFNHPPFVISLVLFLKLSKTFISLGYKKVSELDWYDEEKNYNFEIMAVPAYHWSRRLGQKYNTTLWNTGIEANKEIARKQKRRLPVSYTHLTLPTILLV